MSRSETIAWLAELQAHFGQMLRTPLDRTSGQLRAATGSYSKQLCGAVLPGPRLTATDRLAVYQRQYWFRLFGVLQQEYLLTARLVGMWHFNELAANYLAAHPPAHYDIQRVAPGFAAFLLQALHSSAEQRRAPNSLLVEAADIDCALSRVFLAPERRALRREALARLDLSRARLVQAPSVALVREHWPLVALRRQAQRDRAENVAVPAQLAQPQHWLVLRKGSGHAFVRLDPLAYRLYSLLAHSTVTEALGLIESECAEEMRATLPGRVRTWLQEGMDAGLWVEASE